MPRPSLLARTAIALLAFSSITTALPPFVDTDGTNIVREVMQSTYTHPNPLEGAPSVFVFPTMESIKQDPSHTCNTSGECKRRYQGGNTEIVHSCVHLRDGGMDCKVIKFGSPCTTNILEEYQDGNTRFWTGTCDEALELIAQSSAVPGVLRYIVRAFKDLMAPKAPKEQTNKNEL